jgi:hypothetical protein
MKLVTKYQICVIDSCWEKCDEKCAYMFNVYKKQLSLQTGSRNLTDQKTLTTIWGTYRYPISWEAFLDPSNSYFLFADLVDFYTHWTYMLIFRTIWGTYMKLVTKYQISAINSCWEKCDEKWAYMFNVYKNQQSRQTESRNPMGSKTLPTIWLSNYWWQRSDIWSQASYRYPILWEAFLDPSDSYFLFTDLVGFYTHWTYMHIFRHIFWWQISLSQNIRFLASIVAEKNVTKNVHICSMCIKTN